MPKKLTSETQKIGEIGENIASKFLVKRGFSILDRNYTKKWGELDIVAEKEGKIYFVEVKSVNCGKNLSSLQVYRPEENMHPRKLQRISRAIQTFILSRPICQQVPWIAIPSANKKYYPVPQWVCWAYLMMLPKLPFSFHPTSHPTSQEL